MGDRKWLGDEQVGNRRDLRSFCFEVNIFQVKHFQVFGMTSKFFQKPIAQHRSCWCQRSGDQIARINSQSGGSCNWTTNFYCPSGIFGNWTANTSQQNGVFSYRTSGIGYGVASLATGPLTPVVSVVFLAIELLASITTKSPSQVANAMSSKT